MHHSIRSIVLTNTTLKISALIVGTLLWGLLSTNQKTTMECTIPVSIYNETGEFAVTAPETVTLNLVGTRQHLYSTLQYAALHVDAHTLSPGENRRYISEDNLFLPPTVNMVHCSPSYVVINVASAA